MLMVRENTEGLYVEVERRYGDIAIADVKISRAASERIARVAAQQARARRGVVHVVHKANVLPLTSGLFLDTAHRRDPARVPRRHAVTKSSSTPAP
jgi:homoisocitrate dehydrogenase